MSEKYLPDLQSVAGYDPSHLDAAEIKSLAAMERQYIEEVIYYCRGNIPLAARLLEVSPSTIYRKKAQWSDRAGLMPS